jgi:hypothetical protein
MARVRFLDCHIEVVNGDGVVKILPWAQDGHTLRPILTRDDRQPNSLPSPKPTR